MSDYFACPDCGPRVAADEDGCCAMCGADCLVVRSCGHVPCYDPATNKGCGCPSCCCGNDVAPYRTTDGGGK